MLFSNIALAAFDAQKGINFIASKTLSDGSVEGDIVKTGFATLLFNKIGGRTEAERAADFLKSKEDSQGCFPSGSCRIKDTAVAIIALTNLNREVEKGVKFLKDAQSSGLGSSQLLLQVATSGKGNCTATFEISGQTQKKSFLIEEGRFTSCGNVNFLDLNSNCIKGGLATNFPGISLEIDCTSVTSSTIIGTIFKKGNEIFLGESFNSKIAKIKIESGCYGVSSKASCNLDSSLFAAWGLKEADADFNIIPFLKQNFDKNSPLHLALLYLITDEDRFLDDLKKKQNVNGGFDNSVSTTAFAALALEQGGASSEVQKTKEFLKGKQSSDGSWNGNTLDTTLALLALSDEVVVEIPSFGVIAPITCDNDGVCEAELGEDEDTCPRDCLAPEEKRPKEEGRVVEVCNNDGTCEREAGEDEINCPSDCIEGKEEVEREPEVKEEKGIGGTLIIIIVIVLLVILGFFGYKKFKGKKEEKKPVGRFEFKPFTAQLSKQAKGEQKPSFGAKLFKPVPQKKTVIESELEKSIEEAKKLLKK